MSAVEVGESFEADVLVIGGGLSGTWAAVAAAREGASVILAESNRPAAPCTRSSRFEASEPIPFPSPDSVLSTGCGAISERLRLAFRTGIPPTETPRFKNQRSGSAVSDEV